MPFEAYVEVQGLAELRTRLIQLPDVLQKKYLREVLRKSARPMLAEAKRIVHVLPQSTRWRKAGTVRDAIRLTNASKQSLQGATIGVSINVRGLSYRRERAAKQLANRSFRKFGVKVSSYWVDPFYWYFLEHGWFAIGRWRLQGNINREVLRGKKGRFATRQAMTRSSFRSSRKKAGARFLRFKFLEPAYDAKAKQFVDDFTNGLAEALDKEMK